MMTLEEMKQNIAATKYTDSPRVRTRKELMYAIAKLQAIKSKELTPVKQMLMLEVMTLSKKLQSFIDKE